MTKTFSENVVLTRPFGQLNIKIGDINDIKKEDLKPQGAKLTFKKVYTGFNALTGDVSAELEQSYYDIADVVDNNGNLTIDYLFAPKNTDTDYPVDMTLSMHKADGSQITSKELTSIPIKRNYKTNVTGKLMTAGGAFAVTVNPAFLTPDISHEIVEAKSVAEVTDLLKSNANVVLTEEAINSLASDAPVEIALPLLSSAEDTETTRSVTIPATEKNIVVKYETASAGETQESLKELVVNVSTAKAVEFTAEKSTVIVNGTSIESLTATTADNTLIVGSDLTIGKLILKKGSARLYGKVSNITKDAAWTSGNYKIYRCVSSQQDVDNLLADNVTGYDVILIDQPVSETLDFKATELSKPMMVSQNVEISNLNLTSTETGVLNVIADDLRVILRNSKITNTGAGTADDPCCGIQCTGINPHLELYNSNIVTTGKQIRGITIGGNSQQASCPYVLLDATNIRTEIDSIKNKNYTAEQITAFKSRPYSRGINYFNITGKHELVIKNASSIEGYYYAVNQTFFGGQIVANVTDSYMDGRSAFNVRNSYNEINVSKSVLVGRNYFEGGTEEFGAIVLNYDSDDNFRYAANYTTINISDTEIYSRTNPNTEYNRQYSIDVRSDYNMVNLKGNTKLYEIAEGASESPRLDYFVRDDRGNSKFNIASTVTVQGKAGATVLR